MDQGGTLKVRKNAQLQPLKIPASDKRAICDLARGRKRQNANHQPLALGRLQARKLFLPIITNLGFNVKNVLFRGANPLPPLHTVFTDARREGQELVV